MARSTAPMTPVRKIMSNTIIGRSGRTRRECWEAVSLDDMWAYQRVEDTGSPWVIKHLATDYVPIIEQWSTLSQARTLTAGPDIWKVIWLDAVWFVTNVQEVTDPTRQINGHDRARAVLTWIVDHGHAGTVDQPDHRQRLTSAGRGT